MTRRQRLSLLLTVMLALIVLPFVMLWHGDSTAPNVAPSATEQTESEASKAASTSTSVPQALPTTAAKSTKPTDAVSKPDRSALDDSKLAIDERIARLLDAAEAGDDWAACAGDAEISRCRTLLSWDHSVEDWRVGRLARSGVVDAQINEASARMAAQIERMQQLRKACARLSIDTEQSAMRLRLQAAQAGNVEAMRRFAAAEGIQQDLIANADIYRLYRQYAWPMLMAALEAGDPDAVKLWLDNSSEISYGPLAGVIPADWRDPSTAYFLQRRLSGTTPSETNPESADQVRAVARADALYQRYFADSHPEVNATRTASRPGQNLSDITDIDELTHIAILERDESRCDSMR